MAKEARGALADLGHPPNSRVHFGALGLVDVDVASSRAGGLSVFIAVEVWSRVRPHRWSELYRGRGGALCHCSPTRARRRG